MARYVNHNDLVLSISPPSDNSSLYCIHITFNCHYLYTTDIARNGSALWLCIYLALTKISP
jgi:hypothetical protein